MKNSELFAGLKPYIVELIRSTSLVAGAGTGTTGTGMQVHALDSSWHTGQLDPSQATWALSSYRTVAAGAGLTGGGNLTADISLDVAAGNGIEVTGDAVHVKLKTTSGLELDASGLSMLTPDTLTVSSTNSLAAHTHAITSSANPGAAASLLATDANGLLTLATFRVGASAIAFSSANNIATGPDIQFGTNALIAAESSIYFNIDSDNGTTSAFFRWGMDADTSAATELMRLTETGRLGIGDNSPSYELDVAGSGQLQTSLLTPTITTASGALTLSPTTDVVLTPGSNLVKLSADVALQSANFASQTTGMRITYDGQGDFRYLYTDELHAKSFIADLEQALAGGQIISKSVAVLYADFTAPAAGGNTTLTVRDLPSATGMACFVNGDYIRVRTFARAGGSLTIADCWGTVTLDTSYGTSGFSSATKTQRYTFTRSSAPNAGAMSAGTVVAADAIILDYGTAGNGFYEVNAIDGAYGVNSPYAQIVTWATHPRTQVVRSRLGNLIGIFSAGAEYGLFAGSGTATSDQYLRISDVGVQLNNIPLKLYASGTQRVNIDSTGTDVWFKNAAGATKLAWNGSTLSVDGDGTFSGTITATTGYIGGTDATAWVISAGKIASENIQIFSGTTARILTGSTTPNFAGIITAAAAGDVAMWAGQNTANRGTAPFRVTLGGSLTATDATLTGSLTAGNVSINASTAISIAVGAAGANDAALNWKSGSTTIAQMYAYGTTAGNSNIYMSSGSAILTIGTISSSATVVTLADAAVEVLRIKASGATGYLRASDDSNRLSWTNAGVSVTGTFAVSSTSTFTGAVTAPSVRAASGTLNLGIGTSNYLTVSAAKTDTASTQFGSDWSTNILLAGDSTVGDWVAGYEGRLKRVADLVWFQGRFDPVNSTTSGLFTRIGTIQTAAYIPARDVAYPIIGYYDRGGTNQGYEFGRCHVYTSGEIHVTVPGVWRDYQWIDLTFSWSTQ